MESTSEAKRYFPVVKTIAKRLHETLAPAIDLEKLLACGSEELTRSLGEFKKRQGTTIQTFAYYRIRSAMFDEMRKVMWESRASQTNYFFQQKANQFLEWYSTSSEGFVKRSAEAEAEELKQLCQNLILISLLCRESVDRLRLGEARANQETQSIEDEAKRSLTSALGRLSQREMMLMEGYYFENQPLKELSTRLNMSVSQIQRLHLKTLALLNEFLISGVARINS
jgi:RNA polymerase sigma factor FliA